MTRSRVFVGAPNEARFGFSQAVRANSSVWIAGQVAKDNRTGIISAHHDLAAHVAQALDNVLAVLSAAGGHQRDKLAYVQAHVIGDAHLVRTMLVDRLGSATAITAVGVDGLSHPDYLVEISALATLDDSASVNLRVGTQAVRRGEQVYVGGVAGGSFAAALDRFQVALQSVGAELEDVVWTHIFAVSPIDFESVCEQHRRAFGHAPPAATLVLVRELPDDEARVLIAGAAIAPIDGRNDVV